MLVRHPRGHLPGEANPGAAGAGEPAREVAPQRALGRACRAISDGYGRREVEHGLSILERHTPEVDVVEFYARRDRLLEGIGTVSRQPRYATG